MRTLFSSLCAAGVVALLASHAFAGITYDFVSDQPTYNIAPGGTVQVKVYLQETVSAGSPSLLSPAYGDGLFDFLVNTSLQSGNMSVLSQSANSGFDGTPLPPDANVTGSTISNGGGAETSSPGGAGLFAFRSLSNSDGVLPTVNGDVATILIATLTIQASATPTTSIFRLSDNDAGINNQDFQTFSDAAKDGNYYVFNLPYTDAANVAADAPAFTTNLPTGATFTVNVESEAVPEPASLGILAFGSLGLLIRKRRSNA